MEVEVSLCTHHCVLSWIRSCSLTNDLKVVTRYCPPPLVLATERVPLSVRKYSNTVYAELSLWPRVFMRESFIPSCVVVVAAPSRKLWPAYNEQFRPGISSVQTSHPVS